MLKHDGRLAQKLKSVRYRKKIQIQWILYLLISASDDFSSNFQLRGDKAEKTRGIRRANEESAIILLPEMEKIRVFAEENINFPNKTRFIDQNFRPKNNI